MIIDKTTYLIDTTKGPRMVVRYRLSTGFIKKAVAAFIAIAILLLGLWLMCINAPKVKVHCTNANVLVFQDMEDNYLAYVNLANAEQLEQIRDLNIHVDESVKDFTLCATEVHHYEINLSDEKVFVHGDDVTPPANYNHELSEEELSSLLDASSEETLFLYEELSKIFKTS